MLMSILILVTTAIIIITSIICNLIAQINKMKYETILKINKEHMEDQDEYNTYTYKTTN